MHFDSFFLVRACVCVCVTARYCQDDMLDELHRSVASTKHIAIAVNEELDLHARLLVRSDCSNKRMLRGHASPLMIGPLIPPRHHANALECRSPCAFASVRPCIHRILPI